MAVAFVCPACGFKRSFTDAALGRKVKCDQCNVRVRVVDATHFALIEPAVGLSAPTWTGEAQPQEPEPAPEPEQETAIADRVQTALGTPTVRAKDQNCPVCDTAIDAATIAAGRVRCPKCGTTFPAR